LGGGEENVRTEKKGKGIGRGGIGYSKENLKIHTGVPASPPSHPLLPSPAFPSLPLSLPSFIPFP